MPDRGMYYAIAVAVILVVAGTASADLTFFGPAPYLSAADSPFDLSGLGTTFFLEDFEDGVFDLPPGVSAWGVSMNDPGPFTDSVDSDDGIIDGFGNKGRSMRPTMRYHAFTNPITHYTDFEVHFGAEVGFIPNTFGFVWSDGVVGSRVNVSVRDANFNLIGHKLFDSDMDPAHAGATSSDVFIGFYSSVPIHYVTVSNRYRDNLWFDHFEVDHIQFGWNVPEPQTMTIGIILIGVLLRQRRIQLDTFMR